MKLQISPNTQADIASKLGEKSDKIPHDVNRILQEFAARSFDPITRRDVTAVLNSMGWSTDSPGEWAEIGNAIEARTTKTGERGFYTQRGLRFFGRNAGSSPTSLDHSTTTPTETKLETISPLAGAHVPSLREVEILHREGVSWSPALHTTTPEGLYAEDVGLRRLAVSDSSCYGVGFSTRDDICTLCPLSRFCREASLGVLGDIAAKLDAVTEKALEDAAKSPPLPIMEKNDLVPSVEQVLDEVMGEMVETAQMVNLPTPDEVSLTSLPEEAALDQRYGKGNYKMIPLPFEGVCGHCDATMSKGFNAVHIPGAGVLHPTCAIERP